MKAPSPQQRKVQKISKILEGFGMEIISNKKLLPLKGAGRVDK
jgi:hypothetical protein